MSNSVYILLKSGKEIDLDNFKYLTYPSSTDSKNITTVKTFDKFYLYNRLLTFVGETSIITINSKDIEFVKFFGTFTE